MVDNLRFNVFGGEDTQESNKPVRFDMTLPPAPINHGRVAGVYTHMAGNMGVDTSGPSAFVLAQAVEQDDINRRQDNLSEFHSRVAQATTPEELRAISEEFSVPIQRRGIEESYAESAGLTPENKDALQVEVLRNQNRSMLHETLVEAGLITMEGPFTYVSNRIRETMGFDDESVLRSQETREIIAPATDRIVDNFLDQDNTDVDSFFQKYSPERAGQGKSNYREMLRWMSAMPIKPEQEVDWSGFIVDMANGKVNEAFSLKNREFTTKYGKEWPIQFTAFMAKEVGVDAAVAATVYFSGGKSLLVGKGVKGALVREAVVQAGGAHVQTEINRVIKEEPDFVDEFLMRYAGALTGEALFKGAKVSADIVSKPLRSMVEGLTEKITTRFDLKPVSEDVATKARDVLQEESSSVVSSLADNELLKEGAVAPSKEYRKTVAVVADSVVHPTSNTEGAAKQLANTSRDKLVLDVATAQGLDDGLDTHSALLSRASQFRTMLQSEVEPEIRTPDGFVTRTEAAQQIMTVSVDSLDNFTFRPAEKVGMGKGLIRRNIERVTTPESIFGNMQKDLFDAHNVSASYQSTVQKALAVSTKGLKKDEVDNVMNALDHGSYEARVYTPDELTTNLGLTPKEQDSYYALRTTLDEFWRIQDKQATRVATAKGFKEFKGSLYSVDRTPQGILGAEEVVDGYVLITPVRNTASDLKPSPIKVKESELKDPSTVIGFIEGYLPIDYEGAAYHVSVYDTKGGTVKRVFAGASLKETAERAKELQEELGEDALVYFDKWNDSRKAYEMSFNQTTIRKLDELDPDVVERFKEAVKGSDIGIDADKFGLLVDQFTGASVFAGKIAGKRATNRLEMGRGVSLRPAPDAITNHMERIARMQGVMDWRQHYSTLFKEQYTKLGILDPNKAWDQTIDTSKMSPDTLRVAREAEQRQSYLKRVITGRTSLERTIDDSLHATAKRISETKAGGVALDKIQTLPLLKDVARNARSTSAITAARGFGSSQLLMFYNFSQMYIQASPTIHTLGARLAKPEILTTGLADMQAAIGTMTARKLGARGTKNGEEVYEAITRSGYLSDTETSDMARIFDTKNKLQKVMYDSTIFFRTGIALNKLAAFSVSRREMIDQFKSGKLLGLNGEKFTGTLDDPEFLRLVTNKAKATAIDESKANEIEAFTGLGSAMFQFWQIFPKSARIMFAKNNGLTPVERTGVIAANLAVFGPLALPGVVTVVDGLDMFLEGVTPEDKVNFIDRRKIATNTLKNFGDSLVNGADAVGIPRNIAEAIVKKRGLVAELTEGEVDLVNRMAMGEFLTQFEQHASFKDYVVFLSVMNRTIENGGTLVDLWDGYIAEENPEITPAQLAFKTADVVGNQINSMGYITNAMRNANQEQFDPHFRSSDRTEYRSVLFRSGRRAKDIQVTDNMLLVWLAGLTPGKISADWEKFQEERDVKGAVDEWLKNYERDWLQQPTLQGQRRVNERYHDELIEASGALNRLIEEGQFRSHSDIIDKVKKKMLDVQNKGFKIRGR